MNIEQLNLNTRAYRCLRRASIQEVEQLTKYSYGQLLKIRNLGQKWADHIVEKLLQNGFELSNDSQEKTMFFDESIIKVEYNGKGNPYYYCKRCGSSLHFYSKSTIKKARFCHICGVELKKDKLKTFNVGQSVFFINYGKPIKTEILQEIWEHGNLKYKIRLSEHTLGIIDTNYIFGTEMEALVAIGEPNV